MKKHSTAKPIPCFKRWSRTNYAVFASLHRQVTIGVLAVGMSILLLTTETAAAQQADTSGVSRVMRIEPVGVTGTRLSPSRSIQSQTPVFDRGTEAAAPFQTLEDALRLSPSIDIRERSGKGVQADISIRGGSPDQTMMLLNGINFTDARTGHQTHSSYHIKINVGTNKTELCLKQAFFLCCQFCTISFQILNGHVDIAHQTVIP